ncbi:hypothetical protein NE634_04780 [Lacrimispora saccharolytica]|nr:hypothetical protein [Lacrimispora saccharolytica]
MIYTGENQTKENHIVENLDMSNSVNEEMDSALKEEILKKIGF